MNQEWHRNAGAVFEDFFGIEVPSHYGNYEDEYWAIRKTVAVRDVSYFGKVEVTGKDSRRFLNNMLSNDINSLAVGQGTHALLLDIKGHIQADMKVYSFSDRFLIVCQHYLVADVISQLDRYIISEDVTLREVTDDWFMAQILGPDAEKFLGERGVSSFPPDSYSFIPAEISGHACKLIRLGPGFAVLAEQEKNETLLDALHGRWAGMKAFDIYRIECGLPLMNRDMDHTNFPQEAGLDAALNFKKGCYLGQEVMARIDAQGRVNRRLMGVVSSDVLEAGELLHTHGRDAGKVTSPTFSLLLNQPFALAYVRREFNSEGQQLHTNNTTVIVKELPLSTK
jgi:folate-binding protein YgfZ